jgi:adenylate cyclase
LIASAFNIWYNLAHVQPLLDAEQLDRFMHAIMLYNLIVYPLGIALLVWILRPIYLAYRAEQQDAPTDPDLLLHGQQRSINLPWHQSVVILLAWAGCLPAFLLALDQSATPLDDTFARHLTASLAIAALIHLTHAFFATELLTAKFIFPALFKSDRPANTPNTLPMTLRRRGLLWTLSAGACPIGSLLLLITMDEINRPFAYTVGAMGIAFGLIGTGLMSRLVARPIRLLKQAADAVAEGSLDARVDLIRADEFGPLSDAFNHMIEQMRAKEQLRRTFGLHIGQRAAQQILEADPGLGGRLREITILFCDIRSFTRRCSGADAEKIVEVLNLFLAEMVDEVENKYEGLVNKFLGDGFMAIFGADTDGMDHATHAVRSGIGMLGRLTNLNNKIEDLGHEKILIGIGIHTGSAVVGNIGSSDRLEYTAIGEAVNLAARLEGLTKTLGRTILLSSDTRQAMTGSITFESLGFQEIRGQINQVEVFSPCS